MELPHLYHERHCEDEEDLADLVPAHEVGGLLGLDPELALDGAEGGAQVREEHALDDPQAAVEEHVDLLGGQALQALGAPVPQTAGCLLVYLAGHVSFCQAE